MITLEDCNVEVLGKVFFNETDSIRKMYLMARPQLVDLAEG